MFCGVLVIFRKRAIESAEVTRLKIKKANRIATKRLQHANKLMLNNEHDKFYDEVLRTLWGYVGDKLNIPVEQLSKDNIAEKLAQRNVNEDTVNMFVKAVDECEYNRYAPGDTKGNMNQTFEAAMTAIIKIEDVLSGVKKRRPRMSFLAVLVLAWAFSVPAGAITKKNADAEYKKGNYVQAIRDYEELLKNGRSGDLY